MTTQLPWVFEPCDPEDARDTYGQPWPHAVRGRKPKRPVVMGYGHHPDDAERDAIHKAHQQDAREVLGQRGESMIPAGGDAARIASDADREAMRCEINEYFTQPHEWVVVDDIDILRRFGGLS